MPDWDGRGLPPVAAARARRAAEGGAWTSLLTARAAASLRAMGFDPVGEVMGSIVQRVSLPTYRGCDALGNRGRSAKGPIVRFDAYAPYVNLLSRGYATALRRMLLEASEIGADGVIGVRLTAEEFREGVTEFTALGTGVLARSRTRPPYVFSTDLPAEDVAKLLTAGWVPVDLVFGVSAAVLHRVPPLSWLADDDEFDGYAQLITSTRADATKRFSRRVRTAGADGAIVSSVASRSWSPERSGGHRDRVATVSMFGTSIAHFGRSPNEPTQTLTYMPLT